MAGVVREDDIQVEIRMMRRKNLCDDPGEQNSEKNNGVCCGLVAEESLARNGRENPLFSFCLMLVTLVIASLPSTLSAHDVASYFL